MIMSDLSNEIILKDLKDKHGVHIQQTTDIDALITYVKHISYSEGWTDNNKSRGSGNV